MILRWQVSGGINPPKTASTRFYIYQSFTGYSPTSRQRGLPCRQTRCDLFVIHAVNDE